MIDNVAQEKYQAAQADTSPESMEIASHVASDLAAKIATSEFVLLRDGSQILLRPYAESDQQEIIDFFAHLSPESRLLRFHSAGMSIDMHTIQAVTAGHVVVAQHQGHIVGIGSYVRLRDARRAEVALAVGEDQRGRGVGTVLFERLARDARREGIHNLLAIVMDSNVIMLGLLEALGFQRTRVYGGGEVEVDMALRPDPLSIANADARMHIAASASLEPLFAARTVAVVGASRRAGTIGHELFSNLLKGGFTGTVYPVNPSAHSISSVRAYPSVKAIPEPVDLAIIVVPAVAVLDVAQDCLDAGVRALWSSAPDLPK